MNILFCLCVKALITVTLWYSPNLIQCYYRYLFTALEHSIFSSSTWLIFNTLCSTFILPKMHPAVISDEWNWFHSARVISNKWWHKIDILQREEKQNKTKSKQTKEGRETGRGRRREVEKEAGRVEGRKQEGNKEKEEEKKLILGGSKTTADGDCSHEIKRRLLLGR